MLLGEYAHTFDAKGRVFLPAKHRKDLGETVFVTKLVEQCLVVYPQDQWEKVAQKLLSFPYIQSAQVQREIFGNASEEEIDKQGRILISPTLRQKAGLDKNVYIVGMGNHIEIWSKELWEKRAAESDVEKLTQTLIELGF